MLRGWTHMLEVYYYHLTQSGPVKYIAKFQDHSNGGDCSITRFRRRTTDPGSADRSRWRHRR